MMRMSMRLVRAGVIFAALGVAGVVGSIPVAVSAARAATPKPPITEEASTAIAEMGRSLLADQFSFRARTLRVYPGPNGQPLHIAHSMKVTVRRPDRLSVDVTGDDGSVRLVYDGKSVTLLGVEVEQILDHTGSGHDPGNARHASGPS